MNALFIAVTVILLFIYNIFQSVFLFLTPRRYRRKKDITGHKVLITGAGNGLGRQIAVEFSKQSTCLVLLDINKKALQETSKLLDPQSRAFTYECDITNRKMVYAIAEQIKDDVGDIDILVNNAGIVNGKNLIDLPDDRIVKTLEVNTISHFWMCKSFLPTMMARNRGHIVTISSILGLVAAAKLTDYCASKHAAIGFSESLELEMQIKNLDGIKITIVCTGHMNTGLFKGARTTFGLLSPDYVAHEIVQGVLEDKETIYLPQYMSYLIILKTISPRWLSNKFLEMTKNIYVMENFVGRMRTHQLTN